MALVNPNIALSVKPLELQQRNPLAEAAQVMNLQQAQMQMDKLRRTDEAIERIRQVAVKNGGPGDIMEIAQAYMASPDAGHQELGFKIFQQQRDKADFERVAGNLYPDLFPARAAAAPAAAAPLTAAPANALVPAAAAPAAAPVNALAAAAPAAVAAAPAAAPVNALAAPAAGKSPEQLRREIMLFSQSTDPRAKSMVDVLKGQLQELTKTHTVGGRIVSGAGNVLYEAPPETSDIKEYEYAKKNQGFKGSFIDFMQIKPSAGAARQVMQVNTQLPASEEAQKEFMKEMRQTYSALKQAPTVLDNIEKAKALVPQAKGFMGAGGEGVLQAASFLNNRLGTNINTEGVKSAEELRSRLFLGIMDNLKKLDSQPSQQQQAALQQALGSIGTDPNALPRVLDVFGDTIRQKVDLYNEEASSAESRGVKFPYKPTITLKPRAGAGAGGAGAGAGAVPAGVDPALWNVMTPQERALWRK